MLCEGLASKVKTLQVPWFHNQNTAGSGGTEGNVDFSRLRPGSPLAVLAEVAGLLDVVVVVVTELGVIAVASGAGLQLVRLL
jgi:hypothetical protein